MTTYIKTEWVDGESVIDAVSLNNIENGVFDLAVKLTEAEATIKKLVEQMGNMPIIPADLKKLKSGNISCWHGNRTDIIVNHINRLKLNAVTIPVKLSVETLTSDDFTLNEDNLNYLMNLTKMLTTLGVKISYEMYPFINDGAAVETDWNPQDKNKFFENYTRVWDEFIARLKKENITPYSLIVASNLVKLESYSQEWIKLIKHLRSQINSYMSYRTNWWITASWAQDLLTAYNDKLSNPIFGEVDYICIATYFELTDVKRPTKEEIKAAIKNVPLHSRGQNVYQEIYNFYLRWKKPIVFGELGITNFEGAAAMPYEVQPSDVEYADMQKVWFEAFYETFSEEDWFSGFSVFTIGDELSKFNVVGTSAEPFISNIPLK